MSVESNSIMYIEPNFNKAPSLLSKTNEKEFQKLKDDDSNSVNFLKTFKFSPDGLFILSNSEDNMHRIFNITSKQIQEKLQLESTIKINPCGRIYDFEWFPFMNYNDVSTCHFLTAVSKSPIHCFDALTGKLKSSYSVFNKTNEIQNIFSVSYNNTASKIFCGLDKSIRVFDVNRPGSDSVEISLKQNQFNEQKSLISCISFNQLITGMYAAGSYDKSIGIFDERQPKVLNVLHGHKGGLTQIQFSKSGWYMFSGGRKDNEIHCWDLRNHQIVFSMQRNVETNQKIEFDLNSKFLISGSSNGEIIVYELEKLGEEISRIKTNSNSMINCVKFHNSLPIFGSSSGQRIFKYDQKEENTQEYTPDISLWAMNYETVQTSSLTNQTQNTTISETEISIQEEIMNEE
eukprot:gene3292-5733_t